MIRTRDEALEVLKRCTLKNPPFNVRIQPCGNPGYIFEVSVQTSHRDDGRMLDIRFQFGCDLPVHEEAFIDFVKGRVRAVFIHEFDEAFHVDGIRVDDPHAGGLEFQYEVLAPEKLGICKARVTRPPDRDYGIGPWLGRMGTI